LSGGRGKWEWKKGEPSIVENDAIKGLFRGNLTYTEPIEEFVELKNFLKEFLNNEE